MQIEWGYDAGGAASRDYCAVGVLSPSERKNPIFAISENLFSWITFERFEIIERGFMRLEQVPELRRTVKFGEDRKPETGNTEVWILAPKFEFKFLCRILF